MLTLTGDRDLRDAWARFVTPEDVVGIKINASGAPNINSSPEVVGEVARNLVTAGVKPENIWIYERFKSQVDTVDYAAWLPKGAHVVTADSYLGYDPYTYVEVSFSARMTLDRIWCAWFPTNFTKIINVPNMKDHGASGVTGCLKNIAYGNFGNVARSHYTADTFTLSFIGTLASMEPLRSRTVLQVMDGLKRRLAWRTVCSRQEVPILSQQMMFGTDPVAMDRMLLDIIEDKRQAERRDFGVGPVGGKAKGRRDFRRDPNVNQFIREPGHIEYASHLGLGVVDKARIDMREVKM